MLDAILKSDVNTGDGVAFNVDLGDPGVGEDGQVRTLLLAAQDGVDISNTGTASAAIIGVVGDVEETDTLGQFTLVTDVIVKVLDDGDVHSTGAGLNPVLAELVLVTGVHGLNGVTQTIDQTGEGLKIPTLATLGYPVAAVILERTE